MRTRLAQRIDAAPQAAYLAVMGLVYVLVGFTWVLIPSVGRIEGIDWIPALTPQMVGGAWIVAGTVAATTATTDSHRLYMAGFFGLQFVALTLASYFFIAWLLYLTPLVEGGAKHGLTSAVSYFGFFASASITARFPGKER
ncbi:hypothetical protein ACUH96_00970 [Dermabacteraceae bacterium P13077]|nr:hypothetical protein [Dermabacteraceae bacterium TAE3-ERU27]